MLDQDDSPGIGSWPRSKGSVAAGAGIGAGAIGAMLFGLTAGLFTGAAAFFTAGAVLVGDFFGAAFFALATFFALAARFGLPAFFAFFATFSLRGFFDGRAFFFAMLDLAAARLAFATGRFFALRFFLAIQ